MIHKS